MAPSSRICWSFLLFCAFFFFQDGTALIAVNRIHPSQGVASLKENPKKVTKERKLWIVSLPQEEELKNKDVVSRGLFQRAALL